MWSGWCVIAAILAAGSPSTILETVDIEPVWAGHPVGFCLLTQGDQQFAAYYDAQRVMKAASRHLGETKWTIAALPETTAWDSHNYVTMTIDDDGYIHLSGNMHVAPLKYYRTAKPLDITTFQPVPMVGEREAKCTYPRFLRGAEEALVFTYRDGSSGNGDQIFNIYDLKNRSWRRLMDTPLTAGQGKMNAYLNIPGKGPDGRFHLCWVWRDTHLCETNHDPCYARSLDLVHWETAAGKPLVLPIVLENADVVDPIPPGGGVINGNVRMGFDSRQRPVVSYHKYDANGNTQIYNARFEDGAWRVNQTSDWDFRWDFHGGGSIPFEVSLSGVTPCGPGTLRQAYRSPKGSGEWLLDEATFKILGPFKNRSVNPPELDKIQSDFSGIQIRRADDAGIAPEPGVRYCMQWATLPPHRDKPYEGPLPDPVMLRVFKIRIPVNE